MNQKETGMFIAKLRKELKLTQAAAQGFWYHFPRPLIRDGRRLLYL